ncbi:neural cell adhesion molecule 1-like [Mytilus trossulus]|uniref:neural cell adhesion molecule 1-like n=1 Tax=Mytilus trossulus TaxID=6551 RepID=UPI0030052355
MAIKSLPNGPSAVILSPQTKQYTVRYGQNIPPINCTTNCRPECIYTWFGPHVLSGTKNVLSFENIQKNQRGDYNCKAINEVGSMQSAAINVNVQYEPIVNKVTINGTNFTVSENTRVILFCNFEGNPVPTITWTKNNIILGEDVENSGRSFYTINAVRCKDTGNYSCVANNSLGMSSAQQSLFVTCFPRLNVFKQQPPKIAGLLIGEPLNLTVHIIAYPKLLKVNWTFQSSSTLDDERSHNYTTSLTSDLFTHVAYFYKYHLKKDDFGNYTLAIQNAIGGIVVHFYVDRAGLPATPTDLLVICETSPMVVLWKPGFNGGTPQWFTVIWKDMKTNTSIVKSSIPDSDNGQYVKVTTSSLIDGTTYFIYVEAKEFIKSENVIAVGVGAGIGTSLMILTLAVIVVFIVKRHRHRRNKDINKQHIDDQATYANQSF